MKIKKLHPWSLSPADARQLQFDLAKRVRLCPLKKSPKLVAGLDCAFSKDAKKILAVAVILNLPELNVVESAIAVAPVTYPYIPGLLSFREAPVCLKVVEKLKLRPDIFIIDGQGIAHPRRLGLASHLGLFLGLPTIGCAKSRLIGTYKPPSQHKGACHFLIDKGKTIGAVVQTRANIKPLFVSVGHLCSLDDAVKTVLCCTTRYRIPQPTRLAHLEVTKKRVAL